MKTNKIKVVLSLNKTTISRLDGNGGEGGNKSGEACAKKSEAANCDGFKIPPINFKTWLSIVICP